MFLEGCVHITRVENNKAIYLRRENHSKAFATLSEIFKTYFRQISEHIPAIVDVFRTGLRE